MSTAEVALGMPELTDAMAPLAKVLSETYFCTGVSDADKCQLIALYRHWQSHPSIADPNINPDLLHYSLEQGTRWCVGEMSDHTKAVLSWLSHQTPSQSAGRAATTHDTYDPLEELRALLPVSEVDQMRGIALLMKTRLREAFIRNQADQTMDADQSLSPDIKFESTEASPIIWPVTASGIASTTTSVKAKTEAEVQAKDVLTSDAYRKESHTYPDPKDCLLPSRSIPTWTGQSDLARDRNSKPHGGGHTALSDGMDIVQC